MSGTYKINSHMYNKFVGKYDDIGDIVKIPRKFKNKNNTDEIKANKNILNKKKDSRYSYKNRRIVNKDWKDFNNMQ
jgi:hypothetical protein